MRSILPLSKRTKKTRARALTAQHMRASLAAWSFATRAAAGRDVRLSSDDACSLCGSEHHLRLLWRLAARCLLGSVRCHHRHCDDGEQMKVINLWAGPGAGKSALAAGMFHRVKLGG